MYGLRGLEPTVWVPSRNRQTDKQTDRRNVFINVEISYVVH